MLFFKRKTKVKLNHVFLKEFYYDKIDILNFLVNKALELKIIDDPLEVKNAFLAREAQGETGIGDGIAIPHAKSKSIKKPIILFYKCNTPCDNWGTLDDQAVSIIFALFVPENASKDHLKNLSKLSKGLLNDEVAFILKNSKDDYQIATEITNILNKD